MNHIAFAGFAAVLVYVSFACSDVPSPVEPVTMALSGAAAVANGPPTDLTTGFDFENCGFTLHVELSGRTKTIELPNGGSIQTSPGLTATITNPANGKQVTLNITGATHKTISENGDTVAVATGRNVLLDPTTPELVGVFLTIGRVSWVVTAAGHLVNPGQPLQGPGNEHRVDVCQLMG